MNTELRETNDYQTDWNDLWDKSMKGEENTFFCLQVCATSFSGLPLDRCTDNIWARLNFVWIQYMDAETSENVKKSQSNVSHKLKKWRSAFHKKNNFVQKIKKNLTQKSSEFYMKFCFWATFSDFIFQYERKLKIFETLFFLKFNQLDKFLIMNGSNRSKTLKLTQYFLFDLFEIS